MTKTGRWKDTRVVVWVTYIYGICSICGKELEGTLIVDLNTQGNVFNLVHIECIGKVDISKELKDMIEMMAILVVAENRELYGITDKEFRTGTRYE